MKDNSDEPQDVSSSTADDEKTSIGALLEVANTIRKEQLNESANFQTGTNDTNDVMSGMDSDIVDANNQNIQPDAALTNNGRSAYSAATIAAISSLATGESPLFSDDTKPNNIGNGSAAADETTKREALAKKEISLQDRASAVMSVYKDYLDETEEDDIHDQIGDDDKVDAEPPLNSHERRKEGHKHAILDKFCKDVEEGSINVNSSSFFDDSDEDENGNSTQGSAKSSKKRRFINNPTAASTTAAFRLRAEVALKSAASKTKSVATNAAVAVKTKYKDKTTSSTKLLEKIGRGVENDYDFANYNDESGGGGGDARRRSVGNKADDEDMEYGIPPTENMDGFYGLHMLQRDDEMKSLKRKGQIDGKEMESMQRFNDLCDELGVTPNSHSNLHYFYQQQRSRYKYPAFRSKKCKRAMIYGGICFGFVFFIVSLASAITKGFKEVQRKSANAKPLPDWTVDEEWREKVKESWEQSQTGSMGLNTSEAEQSALVESYHPHWFSDKEGWSGTTYEDAKLFCNSIKIDKDQKDTLHLCPLNAYCPNGPIDDKPLYYEMDAFEGEQWAPISDHNGQWVMVGNGGHATCLVNSPQMSVETLPSAVKRNIMCCHGAHEISADVAGVANSTPETADDAIASANYLDQLFYKVSTAYRPIWYDRSTGWEGRTYQDAVTWCDSYHNYIPCPYEVYCPNQKNLMAGILDQEGESWAPIVNQENEWVQVGTGGVCEIYSERFGEKPEWGVSGANNEAITRHIMCCRAHALLPEEEDTQSQSDEYVMKATSPPLPLETAQTESAIDESELDFDKLEVKLTEYYNPTWFDRETGWKGQTYQESKDFCNAISGYSPCPYFVYCPGNGSNVLGGRKDDGESWAAVIDRDNEWVQVGAGGECNLYSVTEGESPSWGLSGVNNEEITRHIMCCKHELSEEESTVDTTVTVEDESAAEENIVEEQPESSSASTNKEGKEVYSHMTMLEILTMNTFHPEWFDSRVGWLGGSYDEAKAFCESLPNANPKDNHWHLCPRQAYCPNGQREEEPLYLQKDAYDGIQWAPVSDRYNGWMMIGKTSEGQSQTCDEYFDVNNDDPLWGLDGTSSDMKQHILCCMVPSGIYTPEEGEDSIPTLPASNTPPGADEGVILETFSPRWFGVDDGWNSGSHDDANAFCGQHDGIHGIKMKLCPYIAYCPNGKDTQLMIDQIINFNKEEKQWAPSMYGQSNQWVSLSGEDKCQPYMGDSAPTSNPSMKKHILCCSPFQ